MSAEAAGQTRGLVASNQLRSCGENSEWNRLAEAARRLCEENFGNIDLLLSDVVLPNMSGPELAEHLTGLHLNLPVLYMSGYPDEAIRHHGIFQGAINFVEKPFTRTQLALKVREVLDSAKVSG